MRLSSSWSAASLLLGGLHALTAYAAIDKISAVGSKFFYDNGTQYYMKGEYFSSRFARFAVEFVADQSRNCLPTGAT